MKPQSSEASVILFNQLKVDFLLQAERSLSILSPFPDTMRDYEEGINLALLSLFKEQPELRSKLVDYRPDNEEEFPKRCASCYEFPQSAYVAFTGEILYLIGSDEEPLLYTRTGIVEEGLVCGALERRQGCHYLKLIAEATYTSEAYLNAYLEEIKKFEMTLCCDVPELPLQNED